MSIDDEIEKMARELPEDRREEFLRWVEYFRSRSGGGPPLQDMRGLCADLGPGPSEEDIAEARREMWGGFAGDVKR
jgi:hypothetical protein